MAEPIDKAPAKRMVDPSLDKSVTEYQKPQDSLFPKQPQGSTASSTKKHTNANTTIDSLVDPNLDDNISNSKRKKGNKSNDEKSVEKPSSNQSNDSNEQKRVTTTSTTTTTITTTNNKEVNKGKDEEKKERKEEKKDIVVATSTTAAAAAASSSTASNSVTLPNSMTNTSLSSVVSSSIVSESVGGGVVDRNVVPVTTSPIIQEKKTEKKFISKSSNLKTRSRPVVYAHVAAKWPFDPRRVLTADKRRWELKKFLLGLKEDEKKDGCPADIVKKKLVNLDRIYPLRHHQQNDRSWAIEFWSVDEPNVEEVIRLLMKVPNAKIEPDGIRPTPTITAAFSPHRMINEDNLAAIYELGSQCEGFQLDSEPTMVWIGSAQMGISFIQNGSFCLEYFHLI